MHSDSLKKLTARRDDRRFRELYRYFQPSNPAALLYPQYIPSSEQDPSTYTVEGASHALASVPSASNRPISPNATLTSFAQLACVQLNVQRAIIRYVLGVVRMQEPKLTPMQCPGPQHRVLFGGIHPVRQPCGCRPARLRRCALDRNGQRQSLWPSSQPGEHHTMVNPNLNTVRDWKSDAYIAHRGASGVPKRSLSLPRGRRSVHQ
jgi:hypothetical protein